MDGAKGAAVVLQASCFASFTCRIRFGFASAAVQSRMQYAAVMCVGCQPKYRCRSYLCPSEMNPRHRLRQLEGMPLPGTVAACPAKVGAG